MLFYSTFNVISNIQSKTGYAKYRYKADTLAHMMIFNYQIILNKQHQSYIQKTVILLLLNEEQCDHDQYTLTYTNPCTLCSLSNFQIILSFRHYNFSLTYITPHLS